MSHFRSLANPSAALVLAGALLVSLISPALLSAQRAPKRKPGVAVATWQEKGSEGIEVRRVMVRNDTTIPVTITRIALASCVNIRTSCESVEPPLLVLRPGETGQAMTVMPVDIFKKLAFNSGVEWRVAKVEEVAAAPQPRGDANWNHPPYSRQIVMPPQDRPSAIRGDTLSVTFHISATGAIDSVTFPPIGNPDFTNRLRKLLLRYTFTPAVSNGVRTAGKTTLVLVF